MTTLDDVRGQITRLSPAPISDGCVADRLGMAAGQHANMMIRELTASGRFERRRDICSLCYNERLVTRQLAPKSMCRIG